MSRYGIGMTVAYFDQNNEWVLVNIGIISSSELIIYEFFGPEKIIYTTFY